MVRPHRFLAALGAVLAVLAMIACSEPRREKRAAASEQPKWMRKSEAVRVPPEIEKLATANDPDLEKKLTPEEVRATLQAAQQGAPPASAGVETTASDGPTGEWRRMEDDQKAAGEAYQKRLDSITVYRGNGVFARGNEYHNAGCDQLYTLVQAPNGEMVRAYSATAMTLRTARDARLTPHAGCGAPSYQR